MCLTYWQRTEHALDAFVNLLWSQHFQQEKTLSNTQKVAAYLIDRGWKASRQTIQRHKKEGKLRPQTDGSFRISNVEKYAAASLQRLDGSQTGKPDPLQRDKLIAETRKSLAQAEHWEKKTSLLSGELVPKDLFERELAKRASVFRNDLESFARSEAAGIIHLVEGNAGKVSDLIDYMLGKTDDFLDRYAEEKEFTIPAPAVAGQELITDFEDEDSDEE